jgi:hypothetical protein
MSPQYLELRWQCIWICIMSLCKVKIVMWQFVLKIKVWWLQQEWPLKQTHILKLRSWIVSVSGGLLLAFGSTVILGFESCGTHDHILLSIISCIIITGIKLATLFEMITWYLSKQLRIQDLFLSNIQTGSGAHLISYSAYQLRGNFAMPPAEYQFTPCYHSQVPLVVVSQLR